MDKYERIVRAIEDVKEAVGEMGKEFMAAMTLAINPTEPEKPGRKIDGDAFRGWYVDETGFAVDSDGDVLDSDNEEIKQLIEQLVTTAPDAIRAMIDFVNYWDSYLADPDVCMPFVPGTIAERWYERFTKIIIDAGFGSDIKQG